MEKNILDKFFLSADSGSKPANKSNKHLPWLLLICFAWFVLWYFTPGLHAKGIGSLAANNFEQSILIETIVALLLSAVMLLLHKRYSKQLFKHTKIMFLYILVFCNIKV